MTAVIAEADVANIEMDLFTAIDKRHSYRGEYGNEPVPRELLCKIVEAGIKAPSGCNAQTTSFIIVDDPAVVEKIKAIMAKPFLKTAPAFIVCYVDTSPVYQACSFADEDCGAAAENMLLAITASGYASVWLEGALKAPKVKESMTALLKIPEDKEIKILLPVGKPLSEGRQRERKPFNERVSFNSCAS